MLGVMFKILTTAWVYVTISCGIAAGEIILPAVISSNMVLQQRASVFLWGRATVNAEVAITTSWNNKHYKTKSDPSGKWMVMMKTPKAGGPYDISISDGEEIILSNVLVGEVWLCSGQSNMEMTFRGYGANEPVLNPPGEESNNSLIRLFTVKRATGGTPKEDAEGVWNESSPETARHFSAVAYQFGKVLFDSLKVPIGLISSSWGGARIEFWMNGNSLEPFPEVRILAGIDTMKVPEKAPTALYNGMIAPLVKYAIRGVIWYQGESNRDKPLLYAKLLPAMVAEWRRLWQEDDMPFYYVQIAPFAYPNDKKPLLGALMREAQLKAQKNIPHSGMAVIMDAGSELKIHPPDKTIPGQRLAYHALAKTYNRKGIAHESPSYRSMKSDGDKIIISFDHASRGLKSTGDRLSNFEIAAADKVFFPATAKILPGGKVEVRSTAVKSPVAVRYAFKNWAVGDLFSTEGLPASSFRTDNWDISDHDFQ